MTDAAIVRELLYVDCEGTGTNPATDRIVEICVFQPGGVNLTVRVNPGIPIPAEATAVHHITDQDVEYAPPFAAIAADIQALVEGAILCGYSLRRYDTLIIDTELRRAGQRGFPRHPDGRLNVREVDLYQIWQRCEPRTLVSAAKRFAGVELGDAAHGAEADTTVLPATLEGMLAAFRLAGHDVEAICELCIPEGEVDRDGKFRRESDGTVVFNFGQKRGVPVHNEEGLLEWILARDFSAETKAYARQFLAEIEEAWERAHGEDKEEGIEMELPF